jgi:hypothetical protein
MLLGACEDEPAPHEPEAMPLVEVTRLGEVAVADDVFAEHRPMDLDCAEPGFSFEPLGGVPAMELDTTKCPYITIGEATLLDLEEGDVVLIRLFHFELTAPDPAVAHLAVALDGAILWETEVPIPSPSTLVVERVPVVDDVPAGVSLQFHADNHGFNTYSLLEISRER